MRHFQFSFNTFRIFLDVLGIFNHLNKVEKVVKVQEPLPNHFLVDMDGVV